MAFGVHLHRTVHSVGRRLHHAGMTAAKHLDRGLTTVRPVYEAVKPALHHYGIDTKMVDRGLTTYDGIRRAIGK